MGAEGLSWVPRALGVSGTPGPGGWAARPWCPDHPSTMAWAQGRGEASAGGAGQSQEPLLLGWGEREVLRGGLDWGCMGV